MRGASAAPSTATTSNRQGCFASAGCPARKHCAASTSLRCLTASTEGALPPNPAGVSNTAWLGHALFTQFLLPFEIAAVILTVALIAAVMLTLRRRVGVKSQNPSKQVAVKASERIRIVKMASAGKGASTP